MPKPLSLVGIGCGGRTRTYCGHAAQKPERFRVVAAADPRQVRVAEVGRNSGNPDFRAFASDGELFAAGKLADVAIIGTQDSYHIQPATRALELGYDVLLEKPIATDPRQLLPLLATADRLGRKVLVCHVLRYTPFYSRVKEIVASGVLGELVNIEASEGVGDWHQVHSYVRGHWGVTAKATPMIVAKCCHDMDLLAWMADRPCTAVSSFGSLEFFRPGHGPADAPARCTDGCPHNGTCDFDALHYLDRERGWIGHVMDGGWEAKPEQIRAWLAQSPWGRCAWRCDNDAVDRQALNLEFAGGLTATFTMTAFDAGRSITIRGTKGVLRGGDVVKKLSGSDIIVQPHRGAEIRENVATGGGHGGGDVGLVERLDREFAKPAREMRSGLHASVESHLIAYAAEESRLSRKTIDMAEYRLRMA